MKLGLYGGGFKPFTTGHFSKLANAIRDNDKVILFYGLQERKLPKLSKRTGKPLKSQQKFRKIGGSERLYTPEISKEIFDIYESAIEREIPSIEIESTMGTTPMRRIFEILESFAADPTLYEKVTVYGGSDMPAPYLRELHRFDDLVRSGKIQFGAVAPESIDDYLDEERLAALVGRSEEEAAKSLAKYYYPDFDPEIDEVSQDILDMARVRGTAVRGHASGEAGIEEAKRFLPPFLNDDEKQRVVDILLGHTENPVTESRIRRALIRASARFARERLLREQGDKIQSVPPGREAHIYNLYEDLAMPLSDIVEIARLALDGKLENFQEKVDGQNVTFTVRDGVLRFFTKMSLVSDRDLGNARRKIGEGMGMDLAVINDKYGDRPGVAAAFSLGYEALEPVALQFQDSLFKNGDVVVVSGLMTSVNPNTIIYDADTFRFITPVSLTDDPVDQGAYDQFLQQARAATTDAFSMDSVPTAKLVEDLETDDAEIESLMSQLDSVVSDVGLSVGSSTVGEYVIASVEKLLREKYTFIPEDLVPAVANRFATKRGAIANAFKKHSDTTPEDYEQLKRIDGIKADVVAEAIVPLEAVIQRLGVMVIDKLDLALTASNQNELSIFVKNARRQFESGGIIADEKTLERIRISLARLEANEDLFTKATEGIVFTFNGNTYKLTGLFTPINRLRGFFEYGSARLPQMYSDEMNEVIIRAARRFLQEGGDVFKDSSGAPLTVEIELANVEPTLRDFSSKFLEPLDLGDYGAIGSTGKASRSGDLDLAVPVSKDVYDDRNKLKLYKRELVSNLISLGAPDAKITASNIYVLFPISGETQAGEFVQIDLMPTPCVGDTCWLMSGVGDVGVKGTYRNQLLNLIARERGLEGNPREKVTIAYPGGLQIKTLPERDNRGNPIDPSDPKSKRKWKNVGPKISDPATILGMLGVPAAPEDVETFEELVDVMITDPDLSGYLPKFEGYMLRHLSSEKSAASAQRAVDHVNAAIAGRKDGILAEVHLRRAVRQILEESLGRSGSQQASGITRVNFTNIETEYFSNAASFGDGKGEVSVAMSILGLGLPEEGRHPNVRDQIRDVKAQKSTAGTIFGSPEGEAADKSLVGGSTRSYDLLFSQTIVDNVSRILDIPIELHHGVPVGARVEVKEIKTAFTPTKSSKKFRLGTESRAAVFGSAAQTEVTIISKVWHCIIKELERLEGQEAEKVEQDNAYQQFPYREKLNQYAIRKGLSQSDIDFFFSGNARYAMIKNLGAEGAGGLTERGGDISRTEKTLKIFNFLKSVDGNQSTRHFWWQPIIRSRSMECGRFRDVVIASQGPSGLTFPNYLASLDVSNILKGFDYLALVDSLGFFILKADTTLFSKATVDAVTDGGRVRIQIDLSDYFSGGARVAELDND